jgi:hypothetical protein
VFDDIEEWTEKEVLPSDSMWRPDLRKLVEGDFEEA